MVIGEWREGNKRGWRGKGGMVRERGCLDIKDMTLLLRVGPIKEMQIQTITCVVCGCSSFTHKTSRSTRSVSVSKGIIIHLLWM